MDIESHDLFDKNTAKPAKGQSDDTYSDCVDWDMVHEEYHHLIIGPWSSVMTRPDPNKNNQEGYHCKSGNDFTRYHSRQGISITGQRGSKIYTSAHLSP